VEIERGFPSCRLVNLDHAAAMVDLGLNSIESEHNL
jgi:hypothetical protein